MILFNIWDIFFEGLILDVKKKNIKIDIKKSIDLFIKLFTI